MVEHRVLNKLAPDEFVNCDHHSGELLEEIVDKRFVGRPEESLDLRGELSVVVLFVSDEPKQVSKKQRIVLAILFDLVGQALIQLSRPTCELIYDLIFLTNLVEVRNQLLHCHIFLRAASAAHVTVKWAIFRVRNELKLVTYLLDDLQFFVVVPEEDVIDELCSFTPELWIGFDHHTDHIFKFLNALAN